MILCARRARVPVGFLTAALVFAIGGAMIAVLLEVDRQRPAAVRAAELSYLPKGEYLKVAVLGYRQLAADLIWIKALQYFGVRTQTAAGYRWAYHAVDVLTDLDPKFAFAYQVAGTILSVAAGQIQESVAILTKGVRHNPEVWELSFFLGYDYFFELHDPVAAAKYFRLASMLPGSPEYLPKLAARMTVEAGDPDAAHQYLLQLGQRPGGHGRRQFIPDREQQGRADRAEADARPVGGVRGKRAELGAEHLGRRPWLGGTS